MKYDFDQVIDRRNSDSAKWNVYPEDVIPMWVADMDFVSPEPVVRALRERMEHGVFGYPFGLGTHSKKGRELNEVLVDRLQRMYHWQIQPEDLVFLPGVVLGMNLFCHAFGQPGSAALIQTPVYPPFFHAPGHAGQHCQEMMLSQLSDGSYTVDMDAFEAAITPETKTFLLCNPHNPVGRVFRPEELRQMADICLRKGLIICSDEIHGDLIFEGHHHTPIASLDPEIAQNTVTLMAPSKTFNVAGLQCSIAIIPNPELRKRYLASQMGLVEWVGLVGQTAVLAAYRDGQEWLDQVLAYLQGNRDFIYEYVRQEMPGIKMALPEGTYLAWLDCRQVVSEKPYQFFLDKARVAFNDGATFGKGGEGYVRMNFGCRRAMLEEGLSRMKAALDL